eukprot:862295-Rhodomonas_salina.1
MEACVWAGRDQSMEQTRTERNRDSWNRPERRDIDTQEARAKRGHRERAETGISFADEIAGRQVRAAHHCEESAAGSVDWYRFLSLALCQERVVDRRGRDDRRTALRKGIVDARTSASSSNRCQAGRDRHVGLRMRVSEPASEAGMVRRSKMGRCGVVITAAITASSRNNDEGEASDEQKGSRSVQPLSRGRRESAQ